MSETAEAGVKTFELPAQLGLNAAGPLAEQLLALRGGALALDASKVEALGGQCLQVLLAAVATWAGDEAELTVLEPSPSFQDDLGNLGMTVETLLNKGQTQ